MHGGGGEAHIDHRRGLGDLEACAKVPGAPGTTQLQVGQPNSHTGRRGATCCPPGAAHQQQGACQEKKKEPEIGRNTSSKATGHRAVRRAPRGHTTIHKGTVRCEHCGNHQLRRAPSKPSANSPPPPPLPLQGAHILHKGGGCAPRAGRCPPRGWQLGRDQPTAHGTVVRMGGSDNKGDGLASQPRRYRVPGQPPLNRHQVGGVSHSRGQCARRWEWQLRGRGGREF